MFETVIVILLIVILVVIIQFKGDINKQLLLLHLKIDQLYKQRTSETEPGPVANADTPTPVVPPPPPPISTWQRPLPDLVPQPDAVPIPVSPVIPVEPPAPVLPPVTAVSVPPVPIDLPEAEWQEELPVAAAPPEAPVAAKPKRPSFQERYPDLEKFIGENLFNKIGIAILVLGIGFFLKYAIDKDWINEIGRTFIGIICGGLLIGLAHRMRKTFAAFSSVLVGGGVATLYFTVTIAFQEYHLITQPLAFILTILITAFSVVLALSYDRRELAVLAILGGFSAPFMVSNGAGNVVVLFTYILTLNIGMLVLAYYKKWNIVNIISYVATVLLFGSWLAVSITNPPKQPHYGTALVFATLFYVVFFLMNVINNVRNRQRFGAFDICILLSNTFLYYTAGMLLLSQLHATMYQGLFTALMAVFNCLFAFSLYRREQADRTLIYLLIGLVLTFVSLAAPVQLEGNYITLFWAAETVLLFWLSQRSGIALMRYASMLILVLMVFSLLMDWQQLYFDRAAPMLPFANKAFVTSVVATLSFILLGRLVRQESRETNLLPGFPVYMLRPLLRAMTIVLIYTGIQSELWFQAQHHFPLLSPLITGSFNFIAVSVLLYMNRHAQPWVRAALLVLTGVAMIAFAAYYVPDALDVQSSGIYGHNKFPYLWLHYLLYVPVGVMLYQLHRAVQGLPWSRLPMLTQWVVALMVLIMASAELDHIILAVVPHQESEMHSLLGNSHRTGWAILWGAYAFVLMYLGLRWKSKAVRIIAINVFGLTLAKLFLVDFRSLPEGGKIAAFISLGVLLLIISFMYQRLKKMLLTDENKNVGDATPEEQA
ncbi:DUF2339 domain-containing protein [Chitinophaga pendula]|uniref:DUF2339 domain-containing protein n=1 Tax=Chitinophaga TaxID=79328 RepID=UPI000BB09C88|nr:MULTISPECIES: DUF2339 domain-containing protein [Chitinophaga]ASZ14257.1 hypothetical protein CK934_26570 [Chitinophaga sp. MD30]UCJ08099.1 DUF2339 domain-containing protein [Chitinophaga pendula]